MNAQIEAYERGYRDAMEDLQRDIAQSFILEEVEWLHVDPKKRTTEFALKLKLEEK